MLKGIIKRKNYKKKCPTCREIKEMSCFFRDKSRSDGHEGVCKDCRKHARENYLRTYYSEHKDKIKSTSKKNYIKNKDRVLERQKEYNLKNKEQIQKRNRAYSVKWRKNNKAKANSYTYNRRAKLANATSPSADLGKIQEFYYLAEKMTKDSGVLYVVDHIEPLSKGGLHHQDNLQVITAIENLEKWNKYPYKVAVAFNPQLVIVEHT